MPSLHTRGCPPAARWFKPLCTNYHTDIIRLYLTFSVTLSTAPLWAAPTASYLKNTESRTVLLYESNWQFARLERSISYFFLTYPAFRTSCRGWFYKHCNVKCCRNYQFKRTKEHKRFGSNPKVALITIRTYFSKASV